MQKKIHQSNSNFILTRRTNQRIDSLILSKNQQHLAISGIINSSTMTGEEYFSILARLNKWWESSKMLKQLSTSRKFRGHRPLLWQASIVNQLAQSHSLDNTSVSQIMQIQQHRRVAAVWWWVAITIYLRIIHFRSVLWAKRSARTYSQICEASSRGEDRAINREAIVVRHHLQI